MDIDGCVCVCELKNKPEKKNLSKLYEFNTFDSCGEDTI